jgi:hypothetical protein
MINEKVILELINRKERQILVHSYIYYEKNDNIWTDFKYDEVSKELATLIEEHPTVAKQAYWFHYFKEWDGSSGYDLPMDDPWVRTVGERVYRIYLKNRGNNNVNY